jgi:hypothetical protein
MFHCYIHQSQATEVHQAPICTMTTHSHTHTPVTSSRLSSTPVTLLHIPTPTHRTPPSSQFQNPPHRILIHLPFRKTCSRIHLAFALFSRREARLLSPLQPASLFTSKPTSLPTYLPLHLHTPSSIFSTYTYRSNAKETLRSRDRAHRACKSARPARLHLRPFGAPHARDRRRVPLPWSLCVFVSARHAD